MIYVIPIFVLLSLKFSRLAQIVAKVKKDSEFHRRGAEGAEVGKDFTKSFSSLCVLRVSAVNALHPLLAALPR
jgi:hypothetical protein